MLNLARRWIFTFNSIVLYMNVIFGLQLLTIVTNMKIGSYVQRKKSCSELLQMETEVTTYAYKLLLRKTLDIEISILLFCKFL